MKFGLKARKFNLSGFKRMNRILAMAQDDREKIENMNGNIEKRR
jgi:hypothetical protein